MFKVCSFAGCEEVSLPDSPHCSEHAADAATKLAARRAAAQKSDQAQLGRKLYSLPRWKREAHAFLTRNPLCVDCLDLGAVVPATDVDHMLPHRGKTNCSIDSASLVNDLGTLSAEYEFASIIDLGSVQAIRLVTQISVLFSDREDKFWQGSSSFWTPGGDPFWESGSASGDVDVLVSETDDDPAGSPVWTPYQSLDAADFSARAFRFKAVMTVTSEDYEARISMLQVTAKQGV